MNKKVYIIAGIALTIGLLSLMLDRNTGSEMSSKAQHIEEALPITVDMTQAAATWSDTNILYDAAYLVEKSAKKIYIQQMGYAAFNDIKFKANYNAGKVLGRSHSGVANDTIIAWMLPLEIYPREESGWSDEPTEKEMMCGFCTLNERRCMIQACDSEVWKIGLKALLESPAQ